MNLLNPTDAFFVISFINWTWITDAPIAMQDRTFVWGITLMELNEPVPVVKSRLHLVTRRSKRVIRLLSTLTGHKNPWARDAKEKPPRDRGLYSLIPNGSRYYFVTRNTTLLLSVFLVVTSTVPVVAPDGTFVSISEFETTLNFAAVPLKLTLVAPVRSVPRILMAAPTLPEFGSVSTNGPRPTDRLNTVPQPYEQAVLVPPAKVAP
jgi:hypothetical protein